ncbi:MAG: class I SAM-dependent methyltransferase [Ilumatobacteraceae bacterium]
MDADGETLSPSEAEPGGLSLHEFHRRLDAGLLSLEHWEEASIAACEIGGPPDDPHSTAYADWVTAAWRVITRRARYDAAVDEAFDLPGDGFLGRPYPYSSSNPTEVSNYMGAVVAAVAQMGVPPPATVVEYGSGWGHLAMALAATGYSVTAVDLNPASVDLLRRRSAALGLSLEVVQASFLEHRAVDPVDVVVFFEAFHHCERPFEMLDRCADMLGPSGRMVFVADAIYDAFYAPWGVRLDGAATFMAARQGWLELGFRRDFFEAELMRRGFEVSWEVLPWLGAYGTLMIADRMHGDTRESL